MVACNNERMKLLFGLLILSMKPVSLLGNVSDIAWKRRPQLSDFGIDKLLAESGGDPKDFFVFDEYGIGSSKANDDTSSISSVDFKGSNSGTSSDMSRNRKSNFEEFEPEFDNSLTTNVTAQLGRTAVLQCKVLNIEDDSPVCIPYIDSHWFHGTFQIQVSWVRSRDFLILSVRKSIFAKDARFSVLHTKNSGEWNLMLKFLQKRDEGTYICQVPTSTGVKSHFFNLHVMVPTAFILGNDEYHTQAGTTISLVCIVENSLDPPSFVLWHHNGHLINYERSSRISIKTDPGEKTHSRLIISDVTQNDSGNYTCSAPSTTPSSVDVFVSMGDKKTLSLSDHSSSTRNLPVSILILSTIFLLNRHLSQIKSQVISFNLSL